MPLPLRHFLMNVWSENDINPSFYGGKSSLECLCLCFADHVRTFDCWGVECRQKKKKRWEGEKKSSHQREEGQTLRNGKRWEGEKDRFGIRTE